MKKLSFLCRNNTTVPGYLFLLLISNFKINVESTVDCKPKSTFLELYGLIVCNETFK